jgi:hypothetical protein
MKTGWMTDRDNQSQRYGRADRSEIVFESWHRKVTENANFAMFTVQIQCDVSRNSQLTPKFALFRNQGLFRNGFDFIISV